ncbi:lysylphosphatidylglycerol synthase domain-containing protein [Demequina soli]|uniref:lysylphosphatidylglycerol synthase domain-containing protein n=1 Tax=Demequina soli TaxID=1638987 RepID=UPI001471FFB1|nr:lysylphosphatidylglycerol synthase domain-containing protein [Demequina soli]
MNQEPEQSATDAESIPQPAPRKPRRMRSVIIRWAFYLLIIAAFGYFIATVDWASLEGASVNWGWLVLASVIALGFRYLGVIVWRRVLTRLGAHELPRFRTMSDIYAKAWLARYVPGTVPWIAGKIYMAAQHGISKSKLAVSTLVEAAAQVVAVGTVSLLMLAVDPRIGEVSPFFRVVVAIGAVLGLVAMAPPVFNRLLAFGLKILKRGTPVEVGWRLVSEALGLYAFGALLSGAAFALMTRAVAPEVQSSDMLFLIGAFGFSGVVGMLTPLVPSGLGTRDATQMALLLIVLPASTAALVVLVSRVWSAAVDVLFWLVAYVLERVPRRPAPPAPAEPEVDAPAG